MSVSLRNLATAGIVVIVLAGAYFAWQRIGATELPDGIAMGNGRIEATEIDISTKLAGRMEIGSQARIVLDTAPQYTIPASISFVADVAQFTPKTVETQEERQKLVFRIRATIPKELLQKYIRQVKTGLPGAAYVRTSSDAVWPEELKKNLVQ